MIFPRMMAHCLELMGARLLRLQKCLRLPKPSRSASHRSLGTLTLRDFCSREPRRQGCKSRTLSMTSQTFRRNLRGLAVYLLFLAALLVFLGFLVQRPAL